MYKKWSRLYIKDIKPHFLDKSKLLFRDNFNIMIFIPAFDSYVSDDSFLLLHKANLKQKIR